MIRWFRHRAAGLAVVALTGCGSSDLSEGRPAAGAPSLQDGPVDAGEDSDASAWVRVGKPISWGYATLGNTSQEDVVLEAIEVVGASPELEVLGIKVSPPERPHSIGIGRWPVKEVPVRAVRGTRLPPSSDPAAKLGVEVLVGIRSRSEGTWGTRGIRVTYTAGGKRYREEFGQRVEICSDEQKCPPA